MQNDLISRSALIRGVPSSRKATGKTAWDYGVLYMENVIKNAPAVDAVEVGSCDGCYWKAIGRQQKCSCCRRNRYLKDCYEGSAKV